MQTLLIVESPTKAKTITKYLDEDYVVMASVGHIRDLPKNKMGINFDDFSMEYENSKDKKDIISKLKKASKSANKVILASDPDREGEAIAWHLSQILDNKNIKRARFNEITKDTIKKSLSNLQDIDTNLVHAQEARRALDRIVGYELSPLLWKKVRYGLSAGRVQSVALRLVVEREREIRAFKPELWSTLDGIFSKSGQSFLAIAGSKKIWKTQKEAEEALKTLKNKDFKVIDLTKRKVSRRPSAPFITSTLQQEASRKLGYGVKMTMQLAQRLYESGHITYMRTDSTHLSDNAIKDIRDIIQKEFGKEYLPKDIRIYSKKVKGAQEAHEAIRPTNFTHRSAGSDDRQKRLYDLIWKRTVASQMSDAELEQVSVDIA